MKNFSELNEKVCACTEALTAKLDGVCGKRAILLCGGTGCLSSNSMDIKGKFDELVAENGLEDKVSVNIVGCFGFCSQGPFVKIFPEDTLYRLVRPEDVEEMMAAGASLVALNSGIRENGVRLLKKGAAQIKKE